jgi:hypothetical protein
MGAQKFQLQGIAERRPLAEEDPLSRDEAHLEKLLAQGALGGDPHDPPLPSGFEHGQRPGERGRLAEAARQSPSPVRSLSHSLGEIIRQQEKTAFRFVIQIMFDEAGDLLALEAGNAEETREKKGQVLVAPVNPQGPLPPRFGEGRRPVTLVIEKALADKAFQGRDDGALRHPQALGKGGDGGDTAPDLFGENFFQVIFDARGKQSDPPLSPPEESPAKKVYSIKLRAVKRRKRKNP